MTQKKQIAILVLVAIFILYAGLSIQMYVAYGHTGSGQSTIDTIRKIGAWLSENRPQLYLLTPFILIAPGLGTLAVFALMADGKKTYVRVGRDSCKICQNSA